VNDTGENDERVRAGSPAGTLTAQWGILLLAFAVRCLPIRTVFVDGQTLFTDSDSYYHLRRIAYNLAVFPETLEHDSYLSFPLGAQAIWPPTLDWLLALMLRPFCTPGSGGHGIGCQQDLEQILVWVPPVLGALTVWLLYRIALRHFGARVALVSGSVLSVLPAHYWYSQIGFLDHHVAVALSATLLLGASMELVVRCEQVSVARRTLVVPAIGFGAILVANLLLWPGALLYVALAEAVLLVLWIASHAGVVRRHALDCLLVANLTALVLISPFSLGNDWPAWGAFSAVVLSNFQPWLFGALSLFALLASLLFERVSRQSVWMRLATMVPLGVLFLAASIAFIPELEMSVRDSAQWLSRSDDFQAMVGESMPLFMLHGRFTTEIASSRLSYFIYLFPPALVWLGFASRSRGNRSAIYGYLAWALVLFAFTLLQKRFFNTFSIALALTMGVALVRFYDVLADRFSLGRGLRVGCTSLVALAFLYPSLAVYREPAMGIAGAVLGEPAEHSFRTDLNLARREMTSWLRLHTPETAGYLDPTGEPEYGVLARWGEGHFITYGARRPTVMGNFGDDLGRDHFLLARSFFSAEPERGAEILESLRVRYLVIRSRSESRPMAKTLFAGDGSRLGRYRLLHEVRPLLGVDLPSYKIFEFVKGAELLGTAPPRSLVVAELDLVTNLGRETRFETVVEADASGQYRLRLPYATQGLTQRPTDSLQTAARYRISVGDAHAEIAIDEVAVQRGALVTGPSF
jgi:dolichyl-diphosphooligosaccharide--protein glycosyltransferase